MGHKIHMVRAGGDQILRRACPEISEDRGGNRKAVRVRHLPRFSEKLRHDRLDDPAVLLRIYPDFVLHNILPMISLIFEAASFDVPVMRSAPPVKAGVKVRTTCVADPAFPIRSGSAFRSAAVSRRISA